MEFIKEHWKLLAVGWLVIAVVSAVRVGVAKELPAKSKAPDFGVSDVLALNKKLIQTSDSYYQYLLNDSKSFNLEKPVDSDVMTKVFPYQLQDEVEKLEPNNTLRKGPLAITLQKAKNNGSSKHGWDLIIENKTRHYIAYNVETSPSLSAKQCRLKKSSAIKHNAIVLRPREQIKRAECRANKATRFKLSKVQTMQVPEISYFYLSAIPPKLLTLNKRTSMNHEAGTSMFSCSMVLSVALTKAIENKRVTWRDLSDFYARHRCKSYSYMSGYKAFEADNQTPLPAVEETFE